MEQYLSFVLKINNQRQSQYKRTIKKKIIVEESKLGTVWPDFFFLLFLFLKSKKLDKTIIFKSFSKKKKQLLYFKEKY
jgi:hypothetical protein